MIRATVFFKPVARRVGVLAGTLGLSIAAAALAHARGPDFPISVTEVRDRAEARFQELDADRSGEISPEELAAAPDRRAFRFGPHRHLRDHRAMQGGDHYGKRLMRRGEDPRQDNEDMFARLDANADGLLSKDEFDAEKVRDARHEQMQERLFARLDDDGSGGLSREELPDPSRRLAEMDTDGDGLVTRDEARQHRQHRREAQPVETS